MLRQEREREGACGLTNHLKFLCVPQSVVVPDPGAGDVLHGVRQWPWQALLLGEGSLARLPDRNDQVAVKVLVGVLERSSAAASLPSGRPGPASASRPPPR